MQPAAWSHHATSERALALLGECDWSTARIADVGAGRGHFAALLGERLRARGLLPAEHVFACDLMPESFAYDAIPCTAIGADGRLPFPDDWFDAVVSIEVVEHVENQFAFLRELARIVKPGGTVVVTTPNILNANSRLRALLTGFPLLFDPLPLAGDPRTMSGGHINPIGPYYLAYAALRAGLAQPAFHPDRTKHSGAALTVALAPALLLGDWFFRRRLRRKHPELLEHNRDLLRALRGWGLLTCRSAVLRAVKPRPVD